jgi:hypothetical protein
MSWSASGKGTRDEVVAGITKLLDGVASSYPTGTLEGDDIAVARARCLASLAAIDMSAQPYYEDDLVQAVVSGSHSWNGSADTPLTTNFSVSVARVLKAQK